MPQGFKLLNFDHAGCVVSSMKDTLAFWVDAMGGKLVRSTTSRGDTLANITGAHGAEADIAIVEIAGQRIEFLEYRGVAPLGGAPYRPYDTGALHVAFRVDDVEAAVKYVAGYGYSPQGKPQRTGANTINIYVVGPDGATIEFMQPFET